jgi:4-amino-4-deoxy-L-arabinose transferase-like glycosyltransferase
MQASPPTPTRPQSARLIRLALPTLIVLLAACLRLYRLTSAPPGIGHDESREVVEAFYFGQYGVLPSFVHPEPPEIASRMALGVFFRLVGPSIFAARLASALWSILAIALTYQAGRSLFYRSPHREAAGLVGAASTAALVTYLLISRSTFRAATLPPFIAAGLIMLPRAWRTNRRRDYLLAGLLWGGAALTYLPGLLMPPALLAVLIHQAIFNFKAARERLPGLGLMLLAMLAVLLIPLAQELAEPAPLYSRIAEASGLEQVENPLAHALSALPRRYERAVESLYLRGASDPKRNVAGAPLLNPALAVLVGVGVIGRALRPRQLASALLLGLLILMLLPLALSDQPVDGLRQAGEYVVVGLLIGAAALDILALLERAIGQAGRVAGGLALVLIVLVSGAGSARAFYGFFDDPAQWDRRNPNNLGWFFITDRVALGERLNRSTVPTYLPLEDYNFPALRFVLAGRYPDVHPFTDLAAPGEPLDLPDGQAVLTPDVFEGAAPTAYVLLLPAQPPRRIGTAYFLPALKSDQAAALRERALAEGERWQTERDGILGQQLSIAGAENPFDGLVVPDTTALAGFGDELELVGWDAPRALTPGEEVFVTLYWRAAGGRHLTDDYYAFVHLLDRFGNGLTAGGDATIDRWGYSPRVWRRGAVVPDTRRVAVPADLPVGPYGLLIGAYPEFEDKLPAIHPNGEVLGDNFQLWPLKVAAPPTPLPGDLIATDIVLDRRIGLAGYTLQQGGEPTGFVDLTPGEPFTLTLYWRAAETISETYHIFVHVEGPDGAMLASSDGPPQDGAYPTMIWDAGEVIATTHTLTIEPGAQISAVWVGMYEWPNLTRLPAVQAGVRAPDDRAALWLD